MNAWSGVNFGIGCATWGAYPGNRLDDIGSGIGVVHNTHLFDHPQKSVVRAPFIMFPWPIWFADHRNLHELGRRAVAFEAAPSLLLASRRRPRRPEGLTPPVSTSRMGLTHFGLMLRGGEAGAGIGGAQRRPGRPRYGRQPTVSQRGLT